MPGGRLVVVTLVALIGDIASCDCAAPTLACRTDADCSPDLACVAGTCAHAHEPPAGEGEGAIGEGEGEGNVGEGEGEGEGGEGEGDVGEGEGEGEGGEGEGEGEGGEGEGEGEGEGPVDECAAGTDDCSANATCADAPTGFVCTCNAGFVGDGVTCTGTIVKATEADFEQPGSTRVNVDTTTTPGAMLLAGVPATTMSAGPTLSANAGSSAQALARPDGTFLILHGNVTQTTSIYDAASDAIVAGPSTGMNVGDGTVSVERPDGLFFFTSTVASSTRLYDPIGNTFVAGPDLTTTTDAGANALVRNDGTFLVVASAGNAQTRIYDPIGNAVRNAPNAGTTAHGRGGFNIPNADGTFLIVHGHNTNATTLYDPSGTSGTMSAGPTTTANVDAGGHAFQRSSDGKFVIVHGSGLTTTSLYDPVAKTMSAGPALSLAPKAGAFALQRCDGKTVVFKGIQNTTTALYDPTTNAFSTGPAASAPVDFGAFALQRDDGAYLVVHAGGTNATSLYDAGCATVGTYESEPLHPSGITAWTTLTWVQSDNTVVAEIRTATSIAALASATYHAIAQGGSIPAATGDGGTFLQIRFTFTRAVPPSPGSGLDVWNGSSSVSFARQFAQPTVTSISASFQ